MKPKCSLLWVFVRNFVYDKQSLKGQERTRKRRLKKIVKYAYSNSLYYHELYRTNNVNINNFNLEDLPSVNKIGLMNNFDDWLTTKKITKEQLESFTMDKNNISTKFNNHFFVYQTSGTTGSPITIIEDDYAHKISLGTSIIKNWPGGVKTLLKYFWECKIFSTAVVILPFNIFSISSTYAKSIVSNLPKKCRKYVHFIDVDTNIDEIVTMLNKLKPDMVASYPTYIKQLVKKQNNGQLNIFPKIITTLGEKLTEECRKEFETVFKTKMCTIYACTEANSITHECLQKHRQHLNTGWLYLESIDKDGNPVPYGTLSDKCYLTNLSNFSQPLIRYEITDRIILHDDMCECGDKMPWIEIEGRSADMLYFQGDKEMVEIPPIDISIEMHKIGDNIELYQFILHENNTIEIRLKTISHEDKEKTFEQIKKVITKYLSQNHINNLDIYLSKKAPQYESSGKFKEIYQL